MSAHRKVKRDYTAISVALVAMVFSVSAYFIVEHINGVLLYNDAMSHLAIARRVIDSPTPGVSQLGGVWLPLQHILMLPFVGFDALYLSGFAGSVVSMACYVVTVVLIYKIVYHLTDRKFAGVVAAAIFGANVNVLYIQATPMSEMTLYATVVASVYFTQRWAQVERAKYLIGAGASGFLAAMARYESWPILGMLFLSVVIIAWNQRQPGHSFKLHWRRTEDRVILFSVAAFGSIVLWMVYSGLIFKNPLYFQTGEYAKPSLWVSSKDPAVGDWWISIKTYWFAMVGNAPWPILLLAGIGMVYFVVSMATAKRFTKALPVLALLITIPFFIVCLHGGQRPLSVDQISGYLYNIRYGQTMLIPAAIFIGFLAGAKWKLRINHTIGVIGVAATLAFGYWATTSNNVLTYEEPKAWASLKTNVNQGEVNQYLQGHYNNGRVLMETFGNSDIAFKGVPSGELVYEGSFKQWDPALDNPASQDIRWLIVRCGDQPDKLCSRFQNTVPEGYKLVFKSTDGVYTVYNRGE